MVRLENLSWVAADGLRKTENEGGLVERLGPVTKSEKENQLGAW